MIFKTLLLSVATLFVSPVIYSQDITNLLFVGDNGITEDAKNAHSFIAVKSYPQGIYERLDYKMGGPLVMLRTYNDSNLQNLHGTYIEYSAEGNITLKGYYVNNLKEGSWYFYNDTGKVVLTETYENGILTATQNPDTARKDTVPDKPGDREAIFPGGNKAWAGYLVKSLNNSDVSSSVQKSGKVRVEFIVDTTGKTTSVYLRRSVHFSYDEESLRIIRQSPLWEPAVQNGHKVKAYRIQPFTFAYDDK